MKKIISTLFSCLFIVSCVSNINSIPKESKINLKNANIYFKTMGAGEPIIVVHGGPGLDSSYMEPQIERLSDKYNVVFYDQRGSGKSLPAEISAQHVNIKTFVEDIEALRKELGFDTFTILGHSWGGRLAMEYAIAYPENLNKIILISSTPASFAEHEKFGQEIGKRTKNIKNIVAPLFDRKKFYALDKAGLDDMYKQFFATHFADPKEINKLNLNFNVQSAQSGFEVFELMTKSAWQPGFDLSNKLSKIDLPTLIIHGMQDTIPYSSAQEINHSIINSTLISIDNCGHFPYVEKPNEMFAAIDAFMAK